MRLSPSKLRAYLAYAALFVCATPLSLSAQTSNRTHIVAQGETLFSIARRYKIPVEDLKRMNHLKDNRVEAGGVLILDGGANKAMPVASSPIAQGKTHTVKAGETLYGIARQYGTTPEALQQLNHLSGNIAKVGQVLKVSSGGSTARTPIPTTPVSPNHAPSRTTHIVRAGETLFAVAQRYKMSVEALRQLNNLGANQSVQPNQVLRLTANAALPAAGASGKIHAIQAGETLYSIASRYKTSVEALLQVNPDFRNKLSLRSGELLNLPALVKSGVARVHEVQKGEGLADIADKYGVSTTTLKNANKIGGILRAGQKVTIPTREQGTAALDGVLNGANTKGKIAVDRRGVGSVMKTGETYDPNDLVVSHADLPLNTVILVSNRTKNRHTFARVTDRQTTSGILLAVSPKVMNELGADGNTQIEMRVVKKGK